MNDDRENAQEAAGAAFDFPRHNLHGCTVGGPCEPVPFAESDIRGRGRPPAEVPHPLMETSMAEIAARVDRLVLTGDAEYTPHELAEQVRLLVNELRRQERRVTAYLRLTQ